MRIVDVCVTQEDGSFTDEAGNPLTLEEAFLAGSYVNHKGEDFREQAYQAGVRAAMRRERAVCIALFGPSFDRDCRDQIEGHCG